MPSSRMLVLAVAAIAAIAVVVIAGYLVLRDEPAAVTGDLIAYGCKEQNNPWYAVCVAPSDGTGTERLTTHLPTTDPAWCSDGRRLAFTRNEDTGESTLFTHDDVFVMGSDGGDVRQLTPDKDGRSLSQPTWSPDGSSSHTSTASPSRAWSRPGTATCSLSAMTDPKYVV